MKNKLLQHFPITYLAMVIFAMATVVHCILYLGSLVVNPMAADYFCMCTFTFGAFTILLCVVVTIMNLLEKYSK